MSSCNEIPFLRRHPEFVEGRVEFIDCQFIKPKMSFDPALLRTGGPHEIHLEDEHFTGTGKFQEDILGFS